MEAPKLPNGQYLGYILHIDTRGVTGILGDRKIGPQITWGWKGQDRFSPYLFNTKLELPRLGLWSAQGNQYIIAADFDILPVNYATWLDLILILTKTFKNKCLCFNSASGKVKALFVIESPHRSQEAAKEALKRILKPLKGLYEACDKTGQALQVTYITKDLAIQFSKLSKLKVYKFKNLIKEKPKLRKYTGKLPIKLHTEQNRKRVQFLRTLIVTNRLIKDGLQIPMCYWAKELKVSPKTVMKYIKEFRAKGYLILTDNTFIVGIRAFTYRAGGLLHDLLCKIHAVCYKLTNKIKNIQKVTVPTFIRPGTWNQEIFKLSRFFWAKPEEFKRVVRSIPGSDKKKRMKKVDAAIKSRKKYASKVDK